LELRVQKLERIVAEEPESRELDYNGLQRSTRESKRMTVESVVGRR
jgi:hypothetical protein